MLQNYNRWNVLKVFFEDPLPEGGFQLREISRKANLATTSVKNYLDELKKEKLIIEKKHRIHNYPTYYANRDNERFKFLKKLDMVYSLEEFSLLDYLNEKCMPDVIVLFGSASKGEDVKDSDIDLFLQCKEKKLELKKYENKIKRKINIFFSEDFNKLSNELKNNIINGIILKGYLKVF